MRMLPSYLRRQAPYLALLAVFVAVFALVFSLYDLPTEAVGYAAGLCLAAAVCIALYPAVSSYVNEKYRSEIRTAYSEELAGKDADALKEIREEASRKNS